MATIELNIPDGATFTVNGFTGEWADVLNTPTVMGGLLRTFKHVFGNEATSPASTAKKKAGIEKDDEYNDTFTEEMYRGIIAETQSKLYEAMKAGQWATDDRTRGPRMPAASRLEAIRNVLLANDTIAMLKFKKWTESPDTKGNWVSPTGNEYTLAQMMASFESNPELGEERKASLDKRAADKLAAERAEAENRKRIRESATVLADEDAI